MRSARRAVLIATATAALTATSVPARADSILYRCHPNVCRVAPDGTDGAPVTRDGAAGGPAYQWLSASADGSRLGVSYGNAGYVLDASGRRLTGPLPNGGAVLVTQIRPDGRQVATIEQIGELGPPLRTSPYLFLAGADGGGRDTVARAATATGWLGGRLLRSETADEDPFEQQICVLASNADFPCERLVAAEDGHDLWDPAVSPDGTLVAATQAALGATQGQIALYAAASGRLVRVVSSGPADSQPSWSPDGRSIAFTRGRGGLWVAPAGGRPGSERRITSSGSQPVWVRGLRLAGARRARAGTRVRIRVTGALRGSRVRLQRRAGGRWRTLAARTAGGSAATFAVRLPAGRAVLRARGGAEVSNTITVRVVSSG